MGWQSELGIVRMHMEKIVSDMATIYSLVKCKDKESFRTV